VKQIGAVRQNRAASATSWCTTSAHN